MPPGRGGHLTTQLSAVESAGQPTPDVPILSLSGQDDTQPTYLKVIRVPFLFG